MWSGGLNVPTDSAGVEAARDEQLKHTEEYARRSEIAQDAKLDVEKAGEKRTDASTDVAQGRSDVREAEAKTRTYTASLESAQDAELQARHQLQEQWAQLDSQWREWQSSKSLADTKQAIYEHQLNSF